LSSRKKKVTLHSISELTGLSTATVSRVINNRGYVSQECKEKVLEAQKRLNYYPNKKTDAAYGHKMKMIMLNLPNNNNPFWFPFIKAVQNVCNQNALFLLLTFSEDSHEEIFKISSSVRDMKLQGLIFVTLTLTPQLCDTFQRLNIPKVMCTFFTKGKDLYQYQFDYISVDTRQGIYIATSHLIKQGYDKIAYIGLDLDTITGSERYNGFESAMKDARLSINDFWVCLGSDIFSEQRGYEALYKFYEAGNMPNAVCTSNDITALGVYRACHELKIDIPNDLGLIGMDDLKLIYYLTPSISSVNISPFDLGRNAANLLITRMAQKDSLFQNITLDPNLVAKDSTKQFDNVKPKRYDNDTLF
jgi:LacI family transcriptional regulator